MHKCSNDWNDFAFFKKLIFQMQKRALKPSIITVGRKREQNISGCIIFRKTNDNTVTKCLPISLSFFRCPQWSSCRETTKFAVEGHGLPRRGGYEGFNLLNLYYWHWELKQLDIFHQSIISRRTSRWCRAWLGMANPRRWQKRSYQTYTIRKSKYWYGVDQKCRFDRRRHWSKWITE